MAAATIDDYIAAQPESVRPTLRRIRAIMREAAPEATEHIAYGIPVLRIGKSYIVYFGAWKKHVGLYPVSVGDAGFEALVGPWRAARDAVHLPLSGDVPWDVVTRIVDARVRHLRGA